MKSERLNVKVLMVEKKIFEKTEDGLIIRIKIIPNASKNELVQMEDGLKVRITAQPIENKANKALIDFFSKNLRIPKTNITIIKGELNKEKTLLIKGGDEEMFRSNFGIN